MAALITGLEPENDNMGEKLNRMDLWEVFGPSPHAVKNAEEAEQRERTAGRKVRANLTLLH